MELHRSEIDTPFPVSLSRPLLRERSCKRDFPWDITWTQTFMDWVSSRM
jgi:hypothetical protein